MKRFLKQVFFHTGSTNLRDLCQMLTNMGVEYDDSILNDLDQLIEEEFLIRAFTNISGVYYRVNIEAVSGALYEVVLFWAPEIDSVEIQKYEILSNGYDL